jgi:hypothetical protein
MSIQKELRRLSGLDRDQAFCANYLAGTDGLELVGALNAVAGTSGLELNGVCQRIAAQQGGNSNLDALGALASIASISLDALVSNLELEDGNDVFLEDGSFMLLEVGNS